jgi:hypothetical protein
LQALNRTVARFLWGEKPQVFPAPAARIIKKHRPIRSLRGSDSPATLARKRAPTCSGFTFDLLLLIYLPAGPLRVPANIAVERTLGGTRKLIDDGAHIPSTPLPSIAKLQQTVTILQQPSWLDEAKGFPKKNGIADCLGICWCFSPLTLPPKLTQYAFWCGRFGNPRHLCRAFADA